MTSLAVQRALAKFQMSYTFDESKVARDDDGRFTSKGGSGGAPSFRTPPLREPSPGPTIERRSLTRGESWQRVGSKIGDFPKEYVEEAPARLPEAVTGVDWEARLAALKGRRAGRDRVYATREAPADWFKAPPKVEWQVPPDMPVDLHIQTVGALKRVISGTRQDAIAKARETRQKVAVHGIKDRFTAKRRTGDLILPEDAPAGAANRAYNHAAMLALHDFGVLDYDFQMSDDQKAELTPLIPFMRYVRRRLGAEMRSGHLKGATTPYRAAFGQPFKDERRHKVTGDVRLRVRPNDVLVKRMNCRCAEAVAKNCQASDCPRAIGMAEAEFAALASGADDPGPPDDIEMRLRRLEARQDPDGFAARWSGRPRYITREELHALASEAADPTPAQAEAGNYRMGHVRIGGLPFAIETPMGRERRGVSPDGEEWSVTMPAHYGYVKGTEGADEDPVDVYLGPLAHEADLHPVFVVDQVDAETGDFDEHKVMLGFATRPEALRTYDAGFSDGRGPERRDTVTRLTFDEFKDWLGEGDTMAPMGKAELSGGASETMRCLFFHGPTWDGNIPSKAGRGELVDAGYAEHGSGWAYLTKSGIALALSRGLDDEKDAWERRRTALGKAAPRGCADERVAMMMGDADRILAQAGERKPSRWRGVTDPDVEALMPEVDRLVGRPRPPETPGRRMARSRMIGDPRIPLATVLGKAFDEAKVARDEDGKFTSKGGGAGSNPDEWRGRGRFALEGDGGTYGGDMYNTVTQGVAIGGGLAGAAVSAPAAIRRKIMSRRINTATVMREQKTRIRERMRDARRKSMESERGRPQELAAAARRKVMEEARARGGDMAEAAHDAERMAARVQRMKERAAGKGGMGSWLKGQRAASDALKASRAGAASEAATRVAHLSMGPGAKWTTGARLAGGVAAGLLAGHSLDHSAALSWGEDDERTPAIIVGDAIRHVGTAAGAGIGGWGAAGIADFVRKRPLPKAGRWALIAVPAAAGAAYDAYSFASERREARRLAREGGA